MNQTFELVLNNHCQLKLSFSTLNVAENHLSMLSLMSVPSIISQRFMVTVFVMEDSSKVVSISEVLVIVVNDIGCPTCKNEESLTIEGW